jgi:hypothetical protein
MKDDLFQDDDHGRMELPLFVKVWFAIDAVVALAPPVYWWADGRTAPIVGIPTALFYFLTVGLCIASSIVGAELMTRSERAAS